MKYLLFYNLNYIDIFLEYRTVIAVGNKEIISVPNTYKYYIII